MIVLLTALFALILEIIPLPLWMLWIRPEFLLLLLSYWALTRPSRLSLGLVWLLGLVADLLHGSLLGERALLITFIVFLVIKLQARIQLASLREQMLHLFLLVLLFESMQFLFFYVLGHSLPNGFYWLAPLTTALCWPLLLRSLGPITPSRFH